MSNEFDALKNTWKQAKRSSSGQMPVAKIIEQAKAKKRSSVYFQYGNILVLTAVLVMICLFFYYFFPFQETLSRTGVSMMTGGLLLRIIIEIFSVTKAAEINYADTASTNSSKTIAYYRLRKMINGPITIALVLTYVVGFFMLTPEFLKYISSEWMLFFDASFVVVAIFLVWQIGKGIRKEMQDIDEMVTLHKKFENSEGA